jgi:uncharacterized protein (TIGR02996 family)
VTEELALIAGICSHWKDTTPVYAYADYLEEHDLTEPMEDLRLALHWIELSEQWKALEKDEDRRVVATLLIRIGTVLEAETMTEPGEAIINMYGLVWRDRTPNIWESVEDMGYLAWDLILGVVNDRGREIGDEGWKDRVLFGSGFWGQSKLRTVQWERETLPTRMLVPNIWGPTVHSSGIIHATVE